MDGSSGAVRLSSPKSSPSKNPLPGRSVLSASLPPSFGALLSHIFNLVPNIKSYVDRGTLLSRHRDTIAGPRIYLDDFFLLRFVLRAEDKSRKIRAPFEIVDDQNFDLCSERSQDVRQQIVGQRSLLLRPLHKHCDRFSNALIDEHHEYLVLVAKENCVAAAGRSYRTDLNFDNGLTHTQVHILGFPAKARVAAGRFGDLTIGSRTCTITHATPSNSFFRIMQKSAKKPRAVLIGSRQLPSGAE